MRDRTFSAGTGDNAVEEGNFAASQSASTSGWATDDITSYESIAHKRHLKWLMNYQEAAIYLEEGENNEKFDTHPCNQAALPSYLIAHHTFFHVVDILASLLLLILACIEKPSVQNVRVPVEVHASLEILGILVLALDLVFKAKWKGAKVFFKHKRSVAKCVLLLVMLCEAVTVIVRRTTHFRVTRALRPLFLVDTHYCRGIRRFIRQLFQSLPAILELLVLLLFIMLIFSILGLQLLSGCFLVLFTVSGFYLFSPNQNSLYFRTVQDSFVSLFVLLTTANYPDVMMPAYNDSKFSAIFFIVYIAIELYFLMNLFLAVVYDTFTYLEKSKVKKLLLHERSACQYAFRLLVSQNNPNTISLRHFAGLLSYYKPRARKEEIYLMFKTLNRSQTGSLSIEEFYGIYDVVGLTWTEDSHKELWFMRLPFPLKTVFSGVNWLVTLRWFEYFIYAVIIGNFATILYEAILASIDLSSNKTEYENLQHLHATWHSVLFSSIYALEAVLKIVGLGPHQYFTDGWNLFDFVITVVSVAGLFGDLFKAGFFYIVVLRPFRLLRIFKARRRYRDVLGTLFILIDRLISLVATLFMLYYFYAIIGMEIFQQYNMRNCCKGTPVEAFYDTGDGNQTLPGYYYLNNFDDIFVSGVTLFELTVVNNWFIIMEGYASVATDWSRIYFMTFYLITMVVMTVVVAFILEAFMFKIQYRRTMPEYHSIDYMMYEQTLSLEEVHMINNVKMCSWNGSFINNSAGQESNNGDLHFVGKKKRGKNELSVQMYADEIKEWLQEDSNSPSSPTSDIPDTSNYSQNINLVNSDEPNYTRLEEFEEPPVVTNTPLNVIV